MIDAYNIVASRPWLITQESLETILAIANRMGDPDALRELKAMHAVHALQTDRGKLLEGTRTVRAVDGVAVIPVTGPIFRYANLFTEISGATSAQVLATDIRVASENPYIRGIVYEHNSPGGEASGINELAGAIAAASTKKRSITYCGGQMCSASFWLGMAPGDVVIDATAILGSLGVVMSYTDTSKRDEKSDVRHVEIVSSVSPNKRLSPNTDAGRAQRQAVVDALADVFVGEVAKYRRTTTTKVLSDFGGGGVLVGQAAVDAGMADRIGSLEEVIAVLAGRQRN